MPSAPPSASPTAIPMVATRTVTTARAALSSQAAVALRKQLLLIKPCTGGAQAPTEASEADPVKPNQPFAQWKWRPWSIAR